MAYVPDEAVLESHTINPRAYRLFTYYCLRASMNKPYCTVGLKRAAADLHIGYTYASKMRKELISACWIRVERDTTYLLKGVRSVARQAIPNCSSGNSDEAESCQISNSELPNRQEEVAYQATESCLSSNSPSESLEPAPLTTPSEPAQIQAQAAPSPAGGAPLEGGQAEGKCRRENWHYERFAERYRHHYGVSYRHSKADFVQLARLERDLRAELTNELWLRAIDNYFATPQSRHTLADLAARFATFQLHALDRFGKPVEKSSNVIPIASGVFSPKVEAGIPSVQGWVERKLAGVSNAR